MRDFDAEAAALPVLEFDRLMHGYMMREFEPWLQGRCALELGCFEGGMTRLIRNRFPALMVVDASDRCIQIARQRLGSEQAYFIHSTFETVDFKDAKFDSVFLIHSLEHIEDPIAVLRRAKEWLAPEGRLLLAVPNGDAASRQIAVHMGLVASPLAVTEAEAAHGHMRTYDHSMLESQARFAGLKILKSGGILFKALSGAQFDKALAAGVIDKAYLDACYELGKELPWLCSSVYVVCGREESF